MANINSLTSSNSYSSIYGSRNVISGLASGMDTEAMIENSVSGYKNKIAQLQQQMEALTWKQDAFRSITDKLIALSEKYTSFTSKTNLSSNLFFTSAVQTLIRGTYASKVSATGRASSDIKITSVESLATSARYTVGADKMKYLSDDAMSLAGGKIDWDAKETVSNIAGSAMTISTGGNNIRLDFGEDDQYESLEEMVAGINEKLSGISVTSPGIGSPTVSADQILQAELGEDKKSIVFKTVGENKSNSVSITAVSGKLNSVYGVKGTSTATPKSSVSITIDEEKAPLKETKTALDYLSGKSVNVEYNGVSKSISLTNFVKSAKEENWSNDEMTQRLAAYLQDGVDKAFGTGRVTVKGDNDALSFEVKEDSGSTLKVTSGAGEVLGINGGVSNYLNTSSSLATLLGADYFQARDESGNPVTDENGDPVYEKKEFVINGVKVGEFDKDSTLESVLSAINDNASVGVKASFSTLTSQFVFTTTATGADQEINFGDGLASDLFRAETPLEEKKVSELFSDIKWDEDGTATLTLYSFGTRQRNIVIDKETSLSDLADKLKDYVKLEEDGNGGYSLVGLNGNPYSDEDAGQIQFRQADGTTISALDVVDAANVDPNFTAGTDAVLTAEINGQTMTIQRDSNTVNLDGLTVTLKGTFETKDGQEAVSFETRSDSDALVDTIRGFVDEFNAVLKEIHDAYSTQPLTKSSGDKYSPLTDDDKSSMSDNAIASYEEKAKTGILFADSDLSALYGKLRDIFSSSALSEIGLSTSYANGLTQITLDEDKFREALDRDPDKVRTMFTSSKAAGGESDGLITKVKGVLDTYASKSVATPGVLVRKAGTKLSSTSLQSNEIQKKLENIQKQIDKWQTKLSSKIDYYTRQFTALETLMSTMNNQSSMLMGLMGG